MFQAGRGAVVSWDIVGASHASFSPSMEFVLQAVSPVAAGGVLRGGMQVHQTVTMWVGQARRITLGNSPGSSMFAGATGIVVHGGVGWDFPSSVWWRQMPTVSPTR